MSCRAKDLDALLPQTQCGDCGFKGCLPYAKAMVAKEASIDKCPPGGVATMEALAALLDVDPSPYRASVQAQTRLPAIARIQEPECIGCTKCIQACPVDAIVGARQFMHVVVTEDCTGCGLCVEPCPVDCIHMESIEVSCYDKDKARAQYEAKKERLASEALALKKAYQQKKASLHQEKERAQDQAKQDYIQALMLRKKESAKHG